jgi:hypothetical protein
MGNKTLPGDLIYLGVHVPRELVADARTAAIQEGVRFREWVEEAITRKLGDRPQPLGKKSRGKPDEKTA